LGSGEPGSEQCCKGKVRVGIGTGEAMKLMEEEWCLVMGMLRFGYTH